MALTQKHELKLVRYLRDVALYLPPEMPPAQREQALKHLERGLRHELNGLGNKVASDAEVAAVLEQAGPPESRARHLAHEAAQDPEGFAGYEQRDRRVWLGVCLDLADRLGFEVMQVRLLMVLLGVTGPLAFLVYLGLYTEMYWSKRHPDQPEIDTPRLLKELAVVFVIAVVMNVALGYTIQGLDYLSDRFLQRDLYTLYDWGWILDQRDPMFVWTLLLCLPMAAFAGLPMANAWDKTFNILARAGLALYALGISFGLASLIVGLLLSFAEDFQHILEALPIMN